jgi:hypothetical protein
MFHVESTADLNLAASTIRARVERNVPALVPFIDNVHAILTPLVGEAIIRFRLGGNGLPGNQLTVTIPDGRRVILWAVLAEDEEVALRMSFRSNARPDLSFPVGMFPLVLEILKAFLLPLPARIARGDCGESDYVGNTGTVAPQAPAEPTEGEDL